MKNRKRKAPPAPSAIVPVQPEPQDTRHNLPLATIASGTRGTIESMLLDRMSRAENGQRIIQEHLRDVVEQLVTVELCALVRDGVLVQCNVPEPKGKELGEQQRRYLRIRAEEILAQEHSEFEPWFRPKPLSDAIMRGAGISYRRKVWPAWFEAKGCFRCGTRELPHFANGCCQGCWKEAHAFIRRLVESLVTEPNPRRRPRRAPYVLKGTA